MLGELGMFLSLEEAGSQWSNYQDEEGIGYHIYIDGRCMDALRRK